MKIGNFTFVRNDYVGKNKIWVMLCHCGKEKVFWKESAIQRQKTCGCGVDKSGNTKEQRRMLNSRLHSYKSGAKKRGFDWDITYKQFSEITQQDCAYCGIPAKRTNYFENSPSLQKESPNRDWDKYTIQFNGVDRVDSLQGYSIDNCVPCCASCNRAKSDMTLQDFKKHVKRMYEWLFQKELNPR